MLMQELDFEQEAANLMHLRRAMEGFPSLLVPEPIEDFVTPRVIVMEYVPGTKLSEISGVVHTELDGRELAEELFRGYLHQVLVDGMFHADPHPGNILLTLDRRVALLDVGMVGRFDPYEAVRANAAELLAKHLGGDADAGGNRLHDPGPSGDRAAVLSGGGRRRADPGLPDAVRRRPERR